MKPLVILAGPTAVGKTALSIKLAKKINGAIISADSMQVYKHMDIGSAKVMPEEMKGIPHYLIDVLEPSEEFNIVRFQQMAKEALQQIYAAGQIPIIAGGTGFYIQSLLYNIDFSKEESDTAYRTELTAFAKEYGAHALHEKLKDKGAQARKEKLKKMNPVPMKPFMKIISNGSSVHWNFTIRTIRRFPHTTKKNIRKYLRIVLHILY